MSGLGGLRIASQGDKAKAVKVKEVSGVWEPVSGADMCGVEGERGPGAKEG